MGVHWADLVEGGLWVEGTACPKAWTNYTKAWHTFREQVGVDGA